jgi:hypothetical protein
MELNGYYIRLSVDFNLIGVGLVGHVGENKISPPTVGRMLDISSELCSEYVSKIGVFFFTKKV